MSFDADLGPINYVVAAFESAPVPTLGLAQIQALVDSGRICVLDVEFIAKDAAGAVERDFNGASTDIIDYEDVALVADSINAGGVGVVLVYEDLTLLPVLNAWQAEGATVISEGPVIVDDLIDALDATESK